MTVFTAIIELTKASWRVLRRHPSLIWFPILSLGCTILMFAFLAPIIGGFDDVNWGAVLVLLFGLHLVHLFFNAGLTNEALKAMRGEAPTLGSGMSAAAARAPAIATLAAISSTLGLVLEVMGRSRCAPIRIARTLLGTAWSLVTYLAVPVLVQEKRAGVASLRRSGELFRRTWGETTLSEVGIRIVTQHVMVLLVLIAILLVHVFGESLFTLLIVIAVFAFAIGVLGSLEAIYRAALYVFASEGVVPAPFGGPELDAIWRVKPAAEDPPRAEPMTTEPPPDPIDV